MRLPLRLVIDNARRLVLRHRVRPIKVSLGAHRSSKKREGRGGRSVGTDANRAAKSERTRISGCIGTGHLATKPPLPFFLHPRQAITANTGRRLGLVIIGESDKPISLGAIAGIPRSLFFDLERHAVSAADLASPRGLLYITPLLKRIIVIDNFVLK